MMIVLCLPNGTPEAVTLTPGTLLAMPLGGVLAPSMGPTRVGDWALVVPDTPGRVVDVLHSTLIIFDEQGWLRGHAKYIKSGTEPREITELERHRYFPTPPLRGGDDWKAGEAWRNA